MRPMNEPQQLLDFNPDFCRRIAKRGAVICITMLAIAVGILVLFDPSSSQCPAWTISDKNGGTSLWQWVGLLTALPTLWICFIALRWTYVSQLIRGGAAGGYTRFLDSKGHLDEDKRPTVTFPFNLLWVVMVMGWCVLCTIPLWMMLGCGVWPRYLAYLRH